MPLHEYMGWEGPVTNRQHLTFMAFLADDWNRPSRADYYLMQLTAEVRSILAKKPRKIKLKDFLLRFELGSNKPKLTREQAAALAKARWGAFTNGAKRSPTSTSKPSSTSSKRSPPRKLLEPSDNVGPPEDI